MARRNIQPRRGAARRRTSKPTTRRRLAVRGLPAAPLAPAPSPRRANLFRLAHAAWVVVAVLALGVFLASISGYSIAFQGQNPFTPGSDSSSGFFVLSGLASMATAFVSFALAFLLFRRRRNDRMALFVSFYVLSYGVVMAGPLEYLNPLVPGAQAVTGWLIQPVFFTAPTAWLAILFPDGRPVPPWTKWLIPLSMASLLFLPFVDERSISAFDTLPAQILGVIWMALFAAAFWAQIYRYRRVSTPAERDQTKWVVVGLAVWMGVMLLLSIPYLYIQNLPPATPPPAWAAASGSVWFLSLAIIPVALTIAILRHRLYDIDVIINRALVYGALTAILAGLYSASISLFQKLFQAVTGEKSDAAIVLTTLVLASAFTPVRTRLQTTVDRRFKDVHDAQRRLDALAEEIRHGLWVLSPRQASRRLLDEAVAAFDAEGGAVYLRLRGRKRLAHSSGIWSGHPALVVPPAAGRKEYGRLALGPRKSDAGYTPEDAAILARSAEALASAFEESSGRA